jgi:hypothetical protein
MKPHYADVSQAASGRQGACADISTTLPLPHGPTLVDVCIIHPPSFTYLAHAARAKGSAAAFQDRQKYCSNSSHQHAVCTFVPAAVETYRKLGKPMVGYLRILSDIAAGHTLGVTLRSFLVSAFWELSVALVCSQGSCTALVPTS